MKPLLPLLALALLGPVPAQATSQCHGSVARGRIEGAVKLPLEGPDFRAYSTLAATLGRTTAIDRDPEGLSAESYRNLVQELAGLGGPPVDKPQCKAGPQGHVLRFEALGQAQQWPLNPAHEGFDRGLWYEADALLKARDKNLRYWRMEYDGIELVCCVPRKLAKLRETDPIR